MKVYTVNQVSETMGVGIRAIQRRCTRANLSMEKGTYQIPQSLLDKWLSSKRNTNTMRVVPSNTNTYTNELKDEIDKLRKVIVNHNKMFRIMNEKFNTMQHYPTKRIKEELQEPPMRTYKNNHPPSKKGTPSMNNLQFKSTFNPHWNKDN